MKKITQKEINDISFAAGVIYAATEMMLEGRVINSDGELMLQKANDIIEKYNVSIEELAEYIKAIARDGIKEKANGIINRRVLNYSKHEARNSFKGGAH